MTDTHACTRWARLAAAVALVALTAGLAACGGGDDDEDSGSGSGSGTEEGGSGTADATLEITEFQFTDVSAPAGGTLEVVNSSGGAHTVTADDGAFDEEVGDGETIEVQVPAEPGEYPFHCEIHPSMEATLTAE
ncbi:MAG TPA: cupredoxin domain-containing protein [Acidimicrobiales bacterium]|nr:cupredoxin domain-containing protein [Acidimicrobiales bacterium]